MDNLNVLNSSITAAATESGGEERYVIFNLASSVFAVNCKYVVSIEPSAKITEMANAPSGVRGVGYYKDEAINIFDLRTIFGYPSHEYHVEHEINIGGHIQEHEKWAEEIKSGGSASGFTPDASDCKLGKWFAGYTTDNMGVQNMIKRIEPAHEKFHKLVDSASIRISDNQEAADKFFAELDAVKDEMVNMLHELHGLLIKQARELTVVLKINDKKVGIITDNAESVDTLDEVQDLPPAALATEYIRRLGFRKKDRHITLILDVELLA